MSGNFIELLSHIYLFLKPQFIGTVSAKSVDIWGDNKSRIKELK